jgi:hypothetical protein
MAGWGGFLGKIADQFQGRIERIKNEREKLLQERHDILNKAPLSAAGADRLNVIDNRLLEIKNILTTKATD